MKRRVAIVTGGRADFGLVRPIYKALAARPDLEALMIAAAAHLSVAHGGDGDVFAADGIPVAAQVPLLASGDDAMAIARSIGTGVGGFADAIAAVRPDILVLVGDRFEILAAACAALALRVPIAHVHGGETTEGAFDEQIRHAVTKMAHLHFAAAAPYARRIVAMGEEPRRVHVSGAPGLDNLATVPTLSRAETMAALDLPADAVPLLATWHPVTLDCDAKSDGLDGLLSVLSDRIEPIVFTAPNADDGRGSIVARIGGFCAKHPRARLHTALGTRLYFNAMRHAAVMVGNSSSGIIEAPSFALPVVNIGSRQRGRLRAANVIDCGDTAAEIGVALARALSLDFRHSLAGLVNPYGDGHAGAQIADVLASVDLGASFRVKRFYEIAA